MKKAKEEAKKDKDDESFRQVPFTRVFTDSMMYVIHLRFEMRAVSTVSISGGRLARLRGVDGLDFRADQLREGSAASGPSRQRIARDRLDCGCSYVLYCLALPPSLYSLRSPSTLTCRWSEKSFTLGGLNEGLWEFLP